MAVSVKQTFRFGPFVLDVASAELYKDGLRLRVQPQPIQILNILLEHHGELVSRDELQKRLWPSDTFVDFEHGLNTAVKKLRQALGDESDTPAYIETLPRRGYRFIGPLEGDNNHRSEPINGVSGRGTGGPLSNFQMSRRVWAFIAGVVTVTLAALGTIAFSKLFPSDPRIVRSRPLTRTIARIYEYAGTEVRLKREIPKSTLTEPYAYDWLFSDFVDLLGKISAHPRRLSEFGDCENACATSDAYKLQEFIREEPKNAAPDKYLRIVNTGTIGKYVSRWGQREMVYLGGRYTRPVVNKAEFLAAFPNSYGKKAIKPKLIVKGLNLLDACLDFDGTTIPGKTTLMITADRLEMLKVLLAIVNSTVAFFYLKEKYPASSYNQGTTFTKEMINDLPIPELSPNDRTKLALVVDRILAAKRRNIEADVTELEQQIDETIYSLYGLTAAETGQVEQAVARRANKLTARASG